MITHDEKRDYIRMDINCEMTYKPVNATESKTGVCVNLSGAGISFIADQNFDVGLAMEVSIIPSNTITPPMTAYVEVVRCAKQSDNQYEIAAIIKSIKGN